MTPVTVLLVDDRQENLLALEAALRHPRYKLILARSGHEALAHLVREDVAVVLLDVQMPQMDGFETALRIKRNPATRSIPIIFITAISKEVAHVFQGYDAGAVDYLTKPFDDYVLRAKVSVLADLHDKKRELVRANEALQAEIRQRQRAQTALQAAQVELERRVEERTRELLSVNRALAASVQEKEVLLKEIHHRVKNNLQIISSLLRLQAGRVSDPQAVDCFRESQSRILSMALVHEELYGHASLAAVDMASYIHRLTSHLQEAYAVQDTVRLVLELEPVSLPVDAAIPCGLLLTEVVSNAFKHAFPQGRAGSVRILLRPEEGLCTLSVHDDGVGLAPAIAAHEAHTLGLRLVHALAQQLRGRLNVSASPGTAIDLRFPVPDATPLPAGSRPTALSAV